MTNKEFNESFRKRTKAFAIEVLKFLTTVPFNSATQVLSYQLAEASTSVEANYRAFCRGRSKNERYSKICIVVEEADGTIYWFELFEATNYGNNNLLPDLILEGTEILKVTTSIKHSASQ